MVPKHKIILLGSGTSTGVPEVGCYCATCLSTHPRDKRLRTSALIQTEQGKNILLDCSPDFRIQALTHQIDHIEAIVLTHNHYDHIGGLDDLRTIAWDKSISIYAPFSVLESIRHRLHYYFGDNAYTGRPLLQLKEIDETPFNVHGLTFVPIIVHHGNTPIFGYRIGDFAFLTDVKSIPPTQDKLLHSLQLLWLSGLRFAKAHPTHQTIEEAKELVARFRPKHTDIIHLSHHVPPYNQLVHMLPEGVAPAYDGLSYVFDGTEYHQLGEQEVLGTSLKPHEPFIYEDCGAINYTTALEKQERLFNEAVQIKRRHGETQSHLLFCEHEPVLTMGKHAESGNLLVSRHFLENKGIELHHLNRGGDITFHGPGQITGYPIFDLEKFNLGIKEYIYLMEQCIIDLLRVHGIKGERVEGATGVWIDAQSSQARKICAIGVYASRHITMHGFALNVNTDLSYYKLINPCGFTDKGVTSMAQELGTSVHIPLVKQQLEGFFRKNFSKRYRKNSK